MGYETTEIRIDEDGTESHESWVLIGASRWSSTPGRHLFDSEIPHRHFITVTVYRCTRKRQLNHDHHFGQQKLLEVQMSQAQWGAFVSSFGEGYGVPATLTFLNGVGHVPQAPAESRLDKSHAEVLNAGEKALQQLTESYTQLVAAFETGGKKAQREALRDLGIRLENAPKNMVFAAESFTAHVENVVTKARADFEAMAIAAEQQAALRQQAPRQLEEGKP